VVVVVLLLQTNGDGEYFLLLLLFSNQAHKMYAKWNLVEALAKKDLIRRQGTFSLTQRALKNPSLNRIHSEKKWVLR